VLGRRRPNFFRRRPLRSIPATSQHHDQIDTRYHLLVSIGSAVRSLFISCRLHDDHIQRAVESQPVSLEVSTCFRRQGARSDTRGSSRQVLFRRPTTGCSANCLPCVIFHPTIPGRYAVKVPASLSQIDGRNLRDAALSDGKRWYADCNLAQ